MRPSQLRYSELKVNIARYLNARVITHAFVENSMYSCRVRCMRVVHIVLWDRAKSVFVLAVTYYDYIIMPVECQPRSEGHGDMWDVHVGA